MAGETHDLKMPAFGADMATGTLIEWQVEPGDTVRRGDVIAVIETNKGAIELDIFEDTVIDALLVDVGDEICVGASIARLQGAAQQPDNVLPDSTQNKDEQTAPVAEPQQVETEPASETINFPEQSEHQTIINKTDITGADKEAHQKNIQSSTGNAFIPATPAARQYAREQHSDLSAIAAGLNRPVTLNDLINATVVASAQSDQAKPREGKPQSSGDAKQLMRQAISDTVSLSKRTIPHYYLSQRLDITELQAYTANYNTDKQVEERILLAAPLMTAIARLLAKHSQLNGVYIDDNFQPGQTVHLAHAVNVRGSGLTMPVIRNAEKHPAPAMMQVINRQVTEARRGRLPMSQLTGATCCVSSIGERGAEQMWAVILPPQVAIIALGSPHKEAVVVEGRVEVRDVVTAGLSADHRVSDGHIGAKFLYQLNQLLQQPEQLWIDKNSTN